MQHLAAYMSDSVSDLEVHSLHCDQASHAAMREAFGRFTSVTSLFLSSRSSPSFVMSLVTAFQSLTSLKLEVSPWANDWREGIDQFSGSKLSFLPSTLTDVELLVDCYFIEAQRPIFRESILAGLSENAGLKRLSSNLIQDDLRNSDLHSLHQSFAMMLSRLVNLEELSIHSVTHVDASFWRDVMSWFDSSNSQGTNVRKMTLLLPWNAPLEDFETVATTCNRLFPLLEELVIDFLWTDDENDYRSQSTHLFNDDGQL